jgi:hypothetical protein
VLPAHGRQSNVTNLDLGVLGEVSPPLQARDSRSAGIKGHEQKQTNAQSSWSKGSSIETMSYFETRSL